MQAVGFWAQEDCKLSTTARGEAKICIPLEAGKAVGDSWAISSPTSKLAWIAQIIQGRAKLRPALSVEQKPNGELLLASRGSGLPLESKGGGLYHAPLAICPDGGIGRRTSFRY